MGTLSGITGYSDPAPVAQKPLTVPSNAGVTRTTAGTVGSQIQQQQQQQQMAFQQAGSPGIRPAGPFSPVPTPSPAPTPGTQTYHIPNSDAVLVRDPVSGSAAVYTRGSTDPVATGTRSGAEMTWIGPEGGTYTRNAVTGVMTYTPMGGTSPGVVGYRAPGSANVVMMGAEGGYAVRNPITGMTAYANPSQSEAALGYRPFASPQGVYIQNSDGTRSIQAYNWQTQAPGYTTSRGGTIAPIGNGAYLFTAPNGTTTATGSFSDGTFTMVGPNGGTATRQMVGPGAGYMTYTPGPEAINPQTGEPATGTAYGYRAPGSPIAAWSGPQGNTAVRNYSTGQSVFVNPSLNQGQGQIVFGNRAPGSPTGVYTDIQPGNGVSRYSYNWPTGTLSPVLMGTNTPTFGGGINPATGNSGGPLLGFRDDTGRVYINPTTGQAAIGQSGLGLDNYYAPSQDGTGFNEYSYRPMTGYEQVQSYGLMAP